MAVSTCVTMPGPQTIKEDECGPRELQLSDETVRKRSSRVCSYCRIRKVRCDAVHSQPCSQCRSSNSECIVVKRKPRRSIHRSRDSPAEMKKRRKKSEQAAQPPLLNRDDAFEDLTSSLFESLHTPDFEPALATGLDNGFTSPWGFPCVQWVPLDAGDFGLPRYIKALNDRVPIDNLVQLRLAGAFEIPDVKVRDRLLRIYAEYIHPSLPVIDLDELLAAILEDNVRCKVSILLFQAVMFAAIAYADEQMLSIPGYTDRQAAGAAFFRRVQLLYDAHCEDDPITVVQATLLMSHHDKFEDSKGAWYWSGVAISLAKSVLLNHHTDKSRCDAQIVRRKRRVWWSCYIRDRMITVATCRPLRITGDESGVGRLTLDDFDSRPSFKRAYRCLEICSWLHNPATRLALAETCIALADLCVCIGRVFAVQFALVNDGNPAAHDIEARLAPKTSPSHPLELICCHEELNQWRKHLPPTMRLFESEIPDQKLMITSSTLFSHRALLKSLFSTAVTILHFPQITTNSAKLVFVHDSSPLQLYTAANKVTDAFAQLYDQGMLRFVPATATAMIRFAATIHLIEIKHSGPSDTSAARRKLQLCVRFLRILGDPPTVAKSGSDLVGDAFQEQHTGSSIDINGFSLSPSPETTCPNAHQQQSSLPRNPASSRQDPARTHALLPASNLTNQAQPAKDMITEIATTSALIANRAGEGEKIGEGPEYMSRDSIAVAQTEFQAFWGITDEIQRLWAKAA